MFTEIFQPIFFSRSELTTIFRLVKFRKVLNSIIDWAKNLLICSQLFYYYTRLNFRKKSLSISSNFYYFILRDLLIHFRHHRSQTSFLVKVLFVFSWNEHKFLYNKTIENVLCSFLVNQILILFLVKITFYKAKVW